MRSGLTLLVLAGFVAFAGWYGWQALTGDPDADSVAADECVPTAPAGAPPPSEVQVNVYNATDRSGLASTTAGTLRERGFIILEVANDPLGQRVEAPAQVRANPAQQAAADVVIAQVAGAQFVPDERAEPTVDLVLGDAFDTLGPPPAPAAEVPAEPPAEGEPAAEESGAVPAPVAPAC